MHKISFFKGLSEIKNIIKKTKIIPDVINIGGGFPSIYSDLKPEPLEKLHKRDQERFTKSKN